MKDSRIFAVDYETYYDADESIKLQGVARYLATGGETYLVSIVGPNLEYVGPADTAPWHRIEGAVWLSHNSDFDQQVFLRDTQAKLYDGGAGPREWHCTMDMCSYVGLPRSLDKAVEAAFNIELSKDPRAKMKGVHFNDLDEEGVAEIEEYALDDSRYCIRLWDEYGDQWPEIERELSRLTKVWGWQGIHIDTEHAGKGLELLDLAREMAMKRLPWIGEFKPQSRNGLQKACKDADIPCPSSTAQDSEECTKWENKYADKYPWVGAIRELRRANKHFRTLESILNRTNENHVMPYYMWYHGTHTGRWSGGGGVNMQNPPIREEVRNAIGFDFRRCFIPAAGKKFIICDLAQIEPRIIYWLLRDEEMLGAMRGGMSIYEAYARKYQGYRHPDPLKVVDPLWYKKTKAEVLGLGYGMGYKRFHSEANKAGIEYTLTEAQERVADYRRTNAKLVAQWDLLDKEFKNAKEDGNFEVPLPSGRSQHYYDIRYAGRDRGWCARVERGGHFRSFFGGKLFENAIQAIGRDVFAYEGLLNVEQSGIGRVVWTMHDEVILECDLDVDPRDVEALMSTTPEWMPGLPVAAEAEECLEFYEKE